MKQLANNLKRYLKLYFYLARFSVMEVTIYRANSLLLGITPIVWMIIQVIFVSVLFKENKEIAGWNYWEVMLLLGIHELVFLGTWMIFAENLEKFIREVRFGNYDRMLLKPVNQRFLISFNALDFTSIGSLFNTIVILSFSLSHIALKIDFFKLILFFISLICAGIIIYLFYFIIATLSFFITNAEVFTDWLLEASDFDHYPGEVYGNYFRSFLLFGLPILFFGYVPAAILLDKLPSYYALLAVMMVLWLYLISTILWRKGLKRYQSASS